MSVTGQDIYYAYQDEGFFFTHPHLIEGLFSFRKGFGLVYTPVMAFALIGLFLLKDRSLAMRSGIVAVLVVHVYITFSWWCWWYGGTFGQRPMIEIYPQMVQRYSKGRTLCSGVRAWQ